MAALVPEKSTVHYTVSSPVNNLPSSSSPPAIDFLHIYRFPLLPGLHLSYFEGKLRVSTLHPTNSNTWMLRNDVLLHTTTDKQDDVQNQYRAKPYPSVYLILNECFFFYFRRLSETLLKSPVLNDECSVTPVKVAN
ncbi:hypothetical protein Pmani_007302 [Petrolisthes manimaculis]|uniref:Uncharacterized protein n=1 Tax=Petrolisthes manimaculis TaxID=1843537 RepID=A0AAE1UKA0_9EUCA|nr:hypothetical protein Pmani_007302 [Petrolisthes manimaculis]